MGCNSTTMQPLFMVSNKHPRPASYYGIQITGLNRIILISEIIYRCNDISRSMNGKIGVMLCLAHLQLVVARILEFFGLYFIFVLSFCLFVYLSGRLPRRKESGCPIFQGFSLTLGLGFVTPPTRSSLG